MPKVLFFLTALAVCAIVGINYSQKRRKKQQANSGSSGYGSTVKTRQLPSSSSSKQEKQNNDESTFADQEQQQQQQTEDEGSWLVDFQTLQHTSDEFIGAIFHSLPDWSTDDLPSLEALTERMTNIYPAFASQMESVRQTYEQFWNFVSMDEFRRIIEDSRREDSDESLHPEIAFDTQVRMGTELSNEEKKFIAARKNRQRNAFAAFIGVDADQVDPRDVPVVGIASSGGGYRAMNGATGYLKAMKETGMLDCTMYTAGVSGSTWAMAQLYSRLTNGSFDTLVDHLKSHIHTHIANVSNFIAILQASAQNAKTLMQGLIQRYHQQNGTLNVVDVFGMLLGGTLLTEMQTVVQLKLSRQRRFFEDGSWPMPIYCVVHHEVQDLYRWFEFTPFEMGCEELNAWIPIWGFGRRFENGKSIERLPEQTLGTMLGVFGSAFASSLAHFFQEMRVFLPEAAIAAVDSTLTQYKESLLTIHPFSPARFPNPFYKLPSPPTMPEDEITSLFDREYLDLLDAGCDNNLPFYPLLRKERQVDMIIALDLSADIQTAGHLERAEGYAQRRGIDGWPAEARWPLQEQASHEEHKDVKDDETNNNKNNHATPGEKYGLGTCTIFEGSQTTMAYFPLIPNEKYDAEFDPQCAEFCSTWNFVYSAEQVAKLVGLGEANWRDNMDQVKQTLKLIWLKKQRQRTTGSWPSPTSSS
ncbi:acyl transferase/acyl hydrolase/lysophospholipase [Zychaea mexicana]|uniref:acyl transferase/acyl hydrolase/lysophospholipase n=1 Tax=Zychaea mexicana TaxID=64656 RepID=UPI0022FF29B8|nr:acyl transferase/acyl hydrolase/lysophospholipase [Zychaea mexicana]KAI9488138.1 acyl transferase/acyl hydrolase/lysophospholipase [Zychaea mexicana]